MEGPAASLRRQAPLNASVAMSLTVTVGVFVCEPSKLPVELRNELVTNGEYLSSSISYAHSQAITTLVGFTSFGYAVARQSDGKSIVAGGGGLGFFHSDFGPARYLTS
jgi:hypothetical protein